MRDKRAVSAIVTTVIILALALIAVGVVWAVIKGVIDERGESADINARCLDAGVEIDSFRACNVAGECSVTIKNVGARTVDGVRVALGGAVNDTEELESLASGDVTFTVTADQATKEVTASAYFMADDEVTKIVCPNPVTQKVPATAA